MQWIPPKNLTCNLKWIDSKMNLLFLRDQYLGSIVSFCQGYQMVLKNPGLFGRKFYKSLPAVQPTKKPLRYQSRTASHYHVFHRRFCRIFGSSTASTFLLDFSATWNGHFLWDFFGSQRWVSRWVYVVNGGLVLTFPKTVNMEPENQPLEKENISSI